MSEEIKTLLDDEQMTMRDFFALAALEGFSANAKFAHWDVEEVATTAYKQADAMLKARIQ